MRYRALGRGGPRVAEIALGTMAWRDDGSGESGAIFAAYLAAGGNFLDSGNVYGGGASERRVGQLARGGRRDELVLATKYGFSSREGDPNAWGAHRKCLVDAVDGSLRRLGTDRIDLLYVHAWDTHTAADEVMRALDDVVRAGKALSLGLSDTPAWAIARAQTIAVAMGWTPLVALQLEHGLARRTPERELLPAAAALDLTVVAWGTLAGLHHVVAGGLVQDRGTAAAARVRPVVQKIAAEIGRSAAQVALAWSRQRHHVLPLISPTSVAQLDDSLASRDLTLDDDQLTRLDAASRT